MSRYLRLPVVVDAVRFDRTMPGYVAELQAFAPGCHVGPAHVMLPNGVRAEQGWWIVKDGMGIYSAVPGPVFHAQYEAAGPPHLAKPPYDWQETPDVEGGEP